MSANVQEVRERVAEMVHVAHTRRIGYDGPSAWAGANVSETYREGMRGDADGILAVVASLFTDEDANMLRSARPYFERDADGFHMLADTLASLRALAQPQKQHVCGLRGFDPMQGDPPCPACAATQPQKPEAQP